MEDTVRNNVLEIARLLEEHRGENVLSIYIGEMSGWTDFFIISTVRSRAHLKGLLRILNEFFSRNDIEPLNRHKGTLDEGWVLIDCGEFVIHLMDSERRAFYELEKLWFKSEVVYSSRSS